MEDLSNYGALKMSEYNYVEKPFLDQLGVLGWEVIDQGTEIPHDPSKSLRNSFIEVTLEDTFKAAVKRLNTTDDGQLWLTDKQLSDLHAEVTSQSGTNLHVINEKVLNLLYRIQVDKNELTGEEEPNVSLIDFKSPDNNTFHAINQFRIDTPSGVKSFVIPDIVLFVNGLPLVVIECKDIALAEANPMAEAFKQLMRYSEQREETKAAGLREGVPRLFHANQLMIRTTGEQCEFGTVTSVKEEYFSPWRDIHPEKYNQFDSPLGIERPQEMMIQGMLPKETLLDIIKNCTLFMDAGPARIKIACRYQQYRAVDKIVGRLRTGKTPDDRSGIVWHTQGSGKSLTMVFLIRKLRHSSDLKDFKVCLVNDRTDLEEQLGETATLTGENITYIESKAELRDKLSTDSSNLNMVMVHKFQEARDNNPDYLRDALGLTEEVQTNTGTAREKSGKYQGKLQGLPVVETFGVINKSDRILLLIDEAHRTQSSSLGDNLFEAFPNATRLAFTGTPLIKLARSGSREHKSAGRFGGYIDKYKLQDAVDDGATLQILYEGKTAKAAVDRKLRFDEKVDDTARAHVESQLRKQENIDTLKRMAKSKGIVFDDLMLQKTDEETRKLKEKWGTTGELLEADNRIQQISADMVDHYIDNILPNGFKAQVVVSSKKAAIKYKRFIDQALADRVLIEEAQPDPDQSLCDRILFLKSVVVISSDGTNEAAEFVAARRHAREVGAVKNFKRAFNYEDASKEYTGIAFLIVCDMLLTGFDAPIEQVMYIDKKVKDHNLLQTIARVNRVASGKTRGYIVDYVGLANHLRSALSIYGGENVDELMASMKDITVELPLLESRLQRLINLFTEAGVSRIEDLIRQRFTDAKEEFQTLELAIEAMEDIKKRANFEVFLKKFLHSMDIVLPAAAATPFKVPAYRFGYLMVRVRNRYKDETLSISGIGGKVQELIDEHLIALGIDAKIPPVDLLSPQFIVELDKNTNPKAKASEMAHAIRKHCKVKYDEDPAFYRTLSEKLEELIQQHQNNWDELCDDLMSVRSSAEQGRTESVEGVDDKAAAFYDLILQTACQGVVLSEQESEQIKLLANSIVRKLKATIFRANFWHPNNPAIEDLQGELSDLLLLTGIDPIVDNCDALLTEITSLAKVRHSDILS